LHDVRFGSAALQASPASLQEPLQFESVVVSGKQGLPACEEQAPPLQLSEPLQKVPSLQPVPLGSAELQASPASLHEPAQFESDVFSGAHGSPAWFVQAPALQVSEPLQNAPSLQPVPFGSAPLQASAASLHDAAQFPSDVFSGRTGHPRGRSMPRHCRCRCRCRRCRRCNRCRWGRRNCTRHQLRCTRWHNCCPWC
jgi:hypothetical protein